MPPITYPNQRMIRIHRERAASDFLGIKNANWQAAARDLGAHATMLYLYLASNANNYTAALSPVAVRQAIGMARSTYHDQFHKLLDKGYLVPATGNTFDFYEVPQPATRQQNAVSVAGQEFEECPGSGAQEVPAGHIVSPEDTEINNMTDSPNNSGINNAADESAVIIQKPKVKDITIPRPVAEGRARPKPMEQPKKAVFDF